MDPKTLYENQYGKGKLIQKPSFSFLRKIFRKFDIGREEIAIDLLKNELAEKRTLLDLGCGEGKLIFKLMKNFDKLFGIDISPKRIKKAKELAKRYSPDNEKIKFIIADIEKGLPFPKDSFDVVTCVAVLEHLFDVYGVLSEINRVLRKRGILILEIPNIAYIKYRFQLLVGKLPVTSSPFNWKEIGWDGGHLHYFTKKRIISALRESGFNVLRVSGSGFFAKLRNFWPSLLTGDLCIKAKKTKSIL